MGGEGDDLIIDESLISLHDADYFDTMKDPCADDGPDTGVHSRRIASGCQNTYFLYIFSH